MDAVLFRSELRVLSTLLQEVKDGSIQLPDFQRGWVWPVENIVALLSSVSLGYPIGAVMTLETGGGLRFAERPVEGVRVAPGTNARRLILDGQQRLTSLYQALLLNEAIDTQDVKHKKIRVWLYIDIKKAVDGGGHREEAIIVVPEDRKLRSFRGEVIADYSTAEAEYAAHLFPASLVFDYEDWGDAYREHDSDNKDRWQTFRKDVLGSFKGFQVPIIELLAKTPRDAICQIFERVNTGAVALNVFELLTATFAADEFQLREDWKRRRAEWDDGRHQVIKEVSSTDFLQALTLLSTSTRRAEQLAAGKDPKTAPRVGCRRMDMLNLTLEDYERFAPDVVIGLKRAARFLHKLSFYDAKFLPYGGQLVPLAAIFATLGVGAERHDVQVKLEQWFWCGVFGELYGGSTETRFAADLPEVVAWVKGDGDLPRTVADAQFASSRLGTLRTRQSAAYKGIYALLLKEGARDWSSGEPADVDTYFGNGLDIHHVFPKKWCDDQRIHKDRYNSILNKTPLSGRTNRSIGSKAPSKYLADIPDDHGQLDAHIASHLIDVDLLRSDDFDGFIDSRRELMIAQIEKVTGKPVYRDDASGVPAVTLDEDDDTDDQ